MTTTRNHALASTEEKDRRNEHNLVLLAKQGEQSAFAELSMRHYVRLLRKMYRITGNLEDAEDALQYAQLRAFTHIQSFDGRSLFSTWMTRIAINSAVAILRKRKTRREIAIDAGPDDTDGKSYFDIADMRYCPEAHYRNREREERLQEGLRRLRPLHRVVIDLYHVDHLSTREIADRLNISVAAAKSRLSRARRLLRSSL